MMKIKSERETKQIRREFSRLVLKVEQSLEKTNQFEKLVIALQELDEEGWLDECKSVADIFKNSSKFCTYYDTGTLWLLVEELGTNQDKEAYKTYKEKFKKYSQNRLFKFPSGSYSDEEEIGVKMDKNIEKLGAESRGEVLYEINRVFKDSPSLKFHSDNSDNPAQDSGENSQYSESYFSSTKSNDTTGEADNASLSCGSDISARTAEWTAGSVCSSAVETEVTKDRDEKKNSRTEVLHTAALPEGKHYSEHEILPVESENRPSLLEEHEVYFV